MDQNQLKSMLGQNPSIMSTDELELNLARNVKAIESIFTILINEILRMNKELESLKKKSDS